MNIYFSSALIDVKQIEELANVGFQGWEVIAEGPQIWIRTYIFN